MSGRWLGTPPDSTEVDEHDERATIKTDARHAVATGAAQMQKRRIMARTLARHSRCAPVRFTMLVAAAPPLVPDFRRIVPQSPPRNTIRRSPPHKTRVIRHSDFGNRHQSTSLISSTFMKVLNILVLMTTLATAALAGDQ